MVTAYGIDKITSPLRAAYLALMRPLFPEAPARGLIEAEEEVDLLNGQDYLGIFPMEKRRVGDATLHRSRFGTGWIASGRPPRSAADPGRIAVSMVVAINLGPVDCWERD
jgi:hypothetical protein